MGYTDNTKIQEVRALVKKLWIPENRKMTVCIDSYQEGIFRGRFSDRKGIVRSFQSLSQFLVMADQLLEQEEEPQSDTFRRSFSSCLSQSCETIHRGGIPRGVQATFELQILFRQHTSWQGVIFWRDQCRQQSFRSVLELILLIDSALRETADRNAG